MRGQKREARLRARDPRIHLQKTMDCRAYAAPKGNTTDIVRRLRPRSRVKPGNDVAVDNREQEGLTFDRSKAISTAPGTSGLLALDWMFGT
jgi:hypothetical protein